MVCKITWFWVFLFVCLLNLFKTLASQHPICRHFPSFHLPFICGTWNITEGLFSFYLLAKIFSFPSTIFEFVFMLRNAFQIVMVVACSGACLQSSTWGLRQENQESIAIMGHIVRTCLKNQNQKPWLSHGTQILGQTLFYVLR